MDYIHNTKFFGVNARNNMFPACDSIVEALEGQFKVHLKGSHVQFLRELVMKLQYRINRSTEKTSRKKYKGGAYIDHLQIPCFTNKLRTTCITRMNNYNITRRTPISITL